MILDLNRSELDWRNTYAVAYAALGLSCVAIFHFGGGRGGCFSCHGRRHIVFEERVKVGLDDLYSAKGIYTVLVASAGVGRIKKLPYSSREACIQMDVG